MDYIFRSYDLSTVVLRSAEAPVGYHNISSRLLARFATELSLLQMYYKGADVFTFKTYVAQYLLVSARVIVPLPLNVQTIVFVFELIRYKKRKRKRTDNLCCRCKKTLHIFRLLSWNCDICMSSER